LHHRTVGFAGVGIQPRRHIHREDGGARTVQARNEGQPIFVQGAIESGAQQAVHNQRGIVSQFGFQLREAGRRRLYVQQNDAPVDEMCLRGAHVIAVVTFAGQQQNQVVGARQL
jgi:hypothetical protein